MTLGPFLFGAPLALLGLIALPIIYWVLRATPPTPKDAALPSMRLLDQIDPREETPARTPFWLLLMRMIAAAAALIGLSLPVYAPGAAKDGGETGALLIVMDNGWASAPRWNELVSAADSVLDTATRDTPTHLLLTAPRTLNSSPGDRLTRAEMSRRIASLEPLSWSTDRSDALKRLEETGLRPERILWATDGLEAGSGTAFARALSDIAPLSIYAAPPKGAAAITEINADPNGVSVTLRRASEDGVETHYVSALTLDGSALATAEASFEQGRRDAEARFTLPAAALARISRFVATGRQGAGTVWLWDSADRSRRVGLVSLGDVAQPLLSDVHYVRQALKPFATLTEGELEDVIASSPDAIILTDIGAVPPTQLEPLTNWVESGGALIRFAGPRVAAQGDELVPTPLRRSSRALGGSLAWDEPQKIADFPETSPFAGLRPPEDALVKQQVLAEPAPDLQAKTWARLEDGSPLVTADKRGAGSVILFHITAGPDWSNLPYSGVFAQMLRRSIAAGKGEAVDDGEGTYAPLLVLDGYGRPDRPADTAAPIAATEFADITPSEVNPPGLYQGPAGTRAVNAAAGERPTLISDWPAGAVLLGDAEAKTFALGGWLLGGAMILLALDLLIALSVAGRLPRMRKATASVAGGIAALGLLGAPNADAQNVFGNPGFGSDNSANAELTKAEEAALSIRFGYVQTGDARTDEATRSGLIGLSRILYLRTSVEPELPHALNLETDALELYPLIYFALPPSREPVGPEAIERLNTYLRSGGALIIDTRTGGTVGQAADFTPIETMLEGLDAPAMAPVPRDHVLTRSFYLLDGFPGRFTGRSLWIEAPAADASQRRGDGVSRLFIGDADWAAAWAIDERGRPLYSVDGGQQQREMANRFGVNLVMYILTGNYKEDQVHLPAWWERSGRTPTGRDEIELEDILRREGEDD